MSAVSSEEHFLTLKTEYFPLLKLPSLAIHEVLEESKLLELTLLSSVSKKTEEIVKSFIKRKSTRNSYKLEVCIDISRGTFDMELSCGDSDPLKLQFQGNGDRYLDDSQFSKMRIDFAGVTVWAKVNSNRSIIRIYWGENVQVSDKEWYWDSCATEVKTILRYFCNIFKPVISMNINGHWKFLIFEMLEVIEQENAKLDDLSLITKWLECNEYQKFLDLPIGKLSLSSWPSYGLCYKPSAEPMKFRELKLGNAEWVFKLEDFLHCKSVVIEDSKLKKQDFNRFLKMWLESDSVLEHVNVAFSHVVDLRSIVEGISAKPMIRARIEKIFRQFENGKCFGLRRRSGEEAIIYQNERFVVQQTESYQSSTFF